MNTELLYSIALSLVNSVGSITAKKLIAHCGSAEAIFQASAKEFQTNSAIAKLLSDASQLTKTLDRAKQELEFADKNGIHILHHSDERYPKHLKTCEDSPIVLYQKGDTPLNSQKILSIVGTRNATAYGKEQCERIIASLSAQGYNPIIVSGLAFGIDICAHRAALKHGLLTVAVVGHGLDKLYPSEHSSTAREMLQNGGALLSDFTSNCQMHAKNFVSRNRIVAGIADGVLVIESAAGGGSLTTANMAFGYARDVFALPGRVGDTYSRGCLQLIRTNKATLVTSAEDIVYALRWDTANPKTQQLPIFPKDLSEIETQLLQYLKQHTEPQSIDVICRNTALSMPTISAHLLNLEFSGLVKSLSGKMYTYVK
ncbi:MAG: DNA-processing protein DprA [Bacteroidales bacterium]